MTHTLPHTHIHTISITHRFKPDQEYIVKDGAVAIIDAFSGRVLDGRRFTDGLQQSIEAKEKLTVSTVQYYCTFAFLCTCVRKGIVLNHFLFDYP
jgi:preprotein translocase subunit SecA